MNYSIKQLLSSSSSIEIIDTELLLAFSLKKPREFIIAHPESELSFFEYLKFKNFLRKRKSGIPLAYIIGHKDFFGLDFLVNKHTLVPRPDTEILVEAVVDELIINNYPPSPIGTTDGRGKLIIGGTLIDVGTGTGCIPIAILTALKQTNVTTVIPNLIGNPEKNNKKTIKCFAIDISKPALRIAKKNAKKHQVDINFLQGNLLEPFANAPFSMFHDPLVITANLPYLTQEQFNEEPSIRHEPRSALVAGDNGLDLYKKLIEQVGRLQLRITRLRPIGLRTVEENYFIRHSSKAKANELRIFLFLEIDPVQSTPLSDYIKTIFPNAKIEIKKDLAGRDRVLFIVL
ncbi:MAG: peptide chain release factor N(5)-glutamine methyltransferase [Patescibacteria group bacterium]